MKYILILIVSLLSLGVKAESRDAISQVNELKSGICKNHQDPSLCERVVGILIKGVQINGDLYYQCQVIKPTTAKDIKSCQDSKALRELIDTYN